MMKRRCKMSKYTDDEIAEACMKCVDEMEMDTLLQFAYEEMYHHYSEVAKADSLDAFMQKDDEEEMQEDA
jgi:hypothetical protein